MQKTLEQHLAIVGALLKPASHHDDGRIKRPTDLILTMTNHSGRADLLADFCATVGSDVLLVTIDPADQSLEPWESVACVVSCAVKPPTAGRTTSTATLKLSIRNETREGREHSARVRELLETILAMSANDVVSAMVSARLFQEDLPLGEDP